jgi:DNA-binding transcriptional ArsR family regulator
MDCSDRPILAPDVELGIEAGQNQSDLIYWNQLQGMQVVSPEIDEMQRKTFPTIPWHPPIPKIPMRLRAVLGAYAWSLFQSEASHYPSDPCLEHWLKKMSGRIVGRIMMTVDRVEETGRERRVSLNHHGLTKAEMLKVINQKLNELINNRLARPPVRSSDNPAESQEEAKPQRNADSVKNQINDLRDECRLTVEELAESVGLAPRSVYRHLSGKAIPRPSQVATYEKFFSKRLAREIHLKTSRKRH